MTTKKNGARCVLVAGLLALAGSASAAETGTADDWLLQGQFTNVVQYHPPFRSGYSGPNSLPAHEPAAETSDVTGFIGRRLGPHTEAWLDLEVDQGFGLGDTLGVAGFPSGEAYKVGSERPYLRWARAFVRHTVSLGGESEKVEAAPNQFAMARSRDNLVLTVGKFSVVDVFDTNAYAHDPRGDFFNWSVVDAGAFDYAADPWGYTYGGAAEWSQAQWTLRAGLFQMSRAPNGKLGGLGFSQHMWVGELEHRHDWHGHPGSVKLTVFTDRARMGSYREAMALAAPSASVPDAAAVRRLRSKPGVALNLEQEVTSDLGVFSRLSANDGDKETYDFTDVHRSIAAGISLKGAWWQRAQDTVGMALVVNDLSAAQRAYFAAGGTGLLIGDGALRYGPEQIGEAYYAAAVSTHLTVTFDVQRIVHPAYNRDRGPVTVFGLRLHSGF